LLALDDEGSLIAGMKSRPPDRITEACEGAPQSEELGFVPD
jgi:hypothetical protein